MLRKSRQFRPRHGYEFPLVPRRIGMAMKLYPSAYPFCRFYRWPKRCFARMADY